jgi:hypothetical protein
MSFADGAALTKGCREVPERGYRTRILSAAFRDRLQ